MFKLGKFNFIFIGSKKPSHRNFIECHLSFQDRNDDKLKNSER